MSIDLRPPFIFPKAAAVGRMLAKNKVYEHAMPTAKVKALFVSQVEKIIWAYKLSPETTNLPASKSVQEIQVFNVFLRTGILDFEVLQTIDNAIPSPILFLLHYKEKYRYVAAYKRPSEADNQKWVLSLYFETEWTENSITKKELPMVLNMGGLYESLLKRLIPLSSRENETLDDLVLRVDQLRIKDREAGKLESQMKREKQFNRRVALNRTLNELKAAIAELKR